MTGINRQPKGLSNLLGVQAGGENPSEFSGLIRGIMDMYPFYQVDRLRAFVEPYSLAVGQREFIEVPEGEAWLIEFMTVTVTSQTSASEFYSFSFGMERLIGQGLNGVELMAPPGIDVTSSLGAAIQVTGGQLPRPFMATAGQRLTLLLCDENQPGSIEGDFNVIYTLMNV